MNRQIKQIFILCLNFLYGFLSYKYLFTSYLVSTNLTKGDASAYYNPEGESLRIIGLVMLLVWITVWYLANYFLKAVFKTEYSLWYPVCITGFGTALSLYLFIHLEHFSLLCLSLI